MIAKVIVFMAITILLALGEYLYLYKQYSQKKILLFCIFCPSDRICFNTNSSLALSNSFYGNFKEVYSAYASFPNCIV